MKKLQLGTHSIEIYDSIEELSIKRYQKFNKMLLIDSGLGSTMEDFMAHASRISAYIQSDDKDLALKEVRNLIQCVQLAQSEMDPKSAAFAALVHSIDGKVYDGTTDSSILEIQKVIGDTPFAHLVEELNVIKKKLETELITFFPDLFSTAEIKEYYVLLKQKALILADQLRRSDFDYRADELTAIEKKLLTFSDPATFTGSKSVEVLSERQFQDSCLIISRELHLPVADCTVLEFYNALLFVRDQQKEIKKQHGNIVKKRR